MVVGNLTVHKKETTGSGDWHGNNYVSFLPEQSKINRRTNIQQEQFFVSNEFSLSRNVHTKDFGDDIVQEEAFQGLVLFDPQNSVNIADKKIASPKNVRFYHLNQKLTEATKQLNKFADSLGTAEAPMYINLAKKALADSWQFIGEEDSEIRIIIASLEGALRQRKWRDYSSEQVKVVRDFLADCIRGRLQDMNSAIERLSILREMDIDIYPSASEEDYVEEEA